MNPTFDPYYEWLGIPPTETAGGGPHHYRLLGLQSFESNPRVIENAADRLMAQLRGFAAGPNGPLSQKLLNEVAAARVCLLDTPRKAAYDKQLQGKLAAAAPKPQVKLQPVYVQVPVPVPVPTALPPMPSAITAPPPPAEASEAAWPNASPASFKISTSRSSSRYRGESDAGGAVLGLIKIVMGSLGGLAIAVLGVWIFFRSDPLGIFKQPAPQVTANNTTTTIKPKVTPPIVKPPPQEKTTGEKSATTPQSTTATPASKTQSPVSKSKTPVKAVIKPSETSPETEPAVETPALRPLPEFGEPPIGENPLPLGAAVRDPQPTSAEQQAKLAELKKIYESEFESGLKPAGRIAFVSFLLDTTDTLKSDPVARFVLLREAYQRLVQLKNYPEAAKIVDRLDSEFEMEPFKLRLHLLTEASPAARLPKDRQAIAGCASELVVLSMARGYLDEADKFVRIAEGQARALSDSKLRTEMTALKLEIEKLAERFAPVERARKSLAADPSDAEAALVDGQHRCLVQGDWKAGLELLAKSSDPALAQAAQRDLAGPTAEFTAGAIGDAWYDIARSEKAHSDKNLENFYARAHHWYKQVRVGMETGDVARFQQRIEQIEALSLPPHLLEDDATSSLDERLPSIYSSLTADRNE
jgi:hypothetical protein